MDYVYCFGNYSSSCRGKTDFRTSKEYQEKLNKAKNHVLVLHYFEMEFDADACDPRSDFDAFEHVHVEPLENTIVSPYTIRDGK